MKEGKQTIQELVTTVQNLCERVESQPIVSNATLFDLGDAGYTLTTPLLVTLEIYSEEVVARFPAIDAYGSGETESEALEMLKESIVDTYEFLVTQPSKQLGRLPRAWLITLREVMVMGENEPDTI
jgi:hypothetical protein